MYDYWALFMYMHQYCKIRIRDIDLLKCLYGPVSFSPAGPPYHPVDDFITTENRFIMHTSQVEDSLLTDIIIVIVKAHALERKTIKTRNPVKPRAACRQCRRTTTHARYTVRRVKHAVYRSRQSWPGVLGMDTRPHCPCRYRLSRVSMHFSTCVIYTHAIIIMPSLPARLHVCI